MQVLLSSTSFLRLLSIHNCQSLLNDLLLSPGKALKYFLGLENIFLDSLFTNQRILFGKQGHVRASSSAGGLFKVCLVYLKSLCFQAINL